MRFLSEYGMFLLEAVTVVVAILFLVGGILAITRKNKIKDDGEIQVSHLNEKYEAMRDALEQTVLDKAHLKKAQKAQKKAAKAQAKEERKRIFVVRFNGDIRASSVDLLREEITAILTLANHNDEVVALIESPGGVVHGYGLAASQLQRIKDRRIPLIAIVDKVAASGGYLMACVADKIIAAPFAVIGSIGVIAQFPNFHRLLKDKKIDFEQVTAGEFKRTLTVFGENTSKDRKKMQDDLELIHQQFKDFVSQHRSEVAISEIATGEHWLAEKALELKLVDELQTSDDYLLKASRTRDIYEIQYAVKKPLVERLGIASGRIVEKVLRAFYPSSINTL